MSEDWSRAEVEATVRDYLDMWQKEHAAQGYNKSEHRRRLQQIVQRSEGAIERKHMNISSVMIDLGLPAIDGYKPYKNRQALLEDVVLDQLANRPQLLELIGNLVESAPVSHAVGDLLAMLVEAPEPSEASEHVADRVSEDGPSRKKAPVNYLEREARNMKLGAAGELLILEFERERLRRLRQEALAARVEHVAITVGDGEGFDIRSFEEDGRDRLIEVKTTNFSKRTPFFVSAKELRVSRKRESVYHLYRVFDFRNQPRLFQKAGAIDRGFFLEPQSYIASA